MRGRAGGEAFGVTDPEKFTGYDRLRRLRYLSRAGKIPDSSYSSDNIEQITSEFLAEAAAQRVGYVEIRVGGRLGHGIRSAEDPELLNRLRECGVTLELFPTSNLRLGLCDSMGALPIRRLMTAGVSVTVNSDDPVLLGTNISRELEVVATTFAFTSDEVRTLLDTAPRAAFSRPPGFLDRLGGSCHNGPELSC